MPLEFFFTKKEAGLSPALDLRMLYSIGYNSTDKILAISRQVRKKHWFQYLGIMRKEYISYFQDIEKEIGNIRRMRPDIIWGLTSNIILLATIIEREGTEDIQPRLVFTNGEILDQKGRDLIASAFGVGPLDCYASHEFGSIAWECQERKGYHINIDSLVVEFIKEGGWAQPGESGELVITSLNSYAMPLIRYSIGDVGILSDKPCPCGRGLPLMSLMEGRVLDFLLLPDGRKISPHPLRRALIDIPGIFRYQIIQEEKDKITVKIMKGEGFSAETIDKIREKCRAILGDNIEAKPLVVDDLPKDKSGKFRVVIS
jgi:phenylacetate-CoA ligase